MTPKELSSGVLLYNWLMITRGMAPRLSSITMRVSSVDSSRRSEMPSICLVWISSAIRITSEARFTL